jgi:hypothetical protein
MSIHKLSAGSGYDYLTRQVAALDATEKGHVGLAAYYTERGESPGSWVGSGLAGIDGLSAGDPVTAEQMKALFGAGMHPFATQRLEQIGAADLTDANIKAATRLGTPFKIYGGDISPFRAEVAKRLAAQHAPVGQLGNDPIFAADRARSAPRWRGSSSGTSMAVIRSMIARSLRLSLRDRGRTPKRLPALT